MCNKSNGSAKAREMKWSRTNASLEVVQGVCGEKSCQAIKYKGRERKSASSTLSLHRVVLRNQNNLPPYEGLLLLYPIYIHRQPPQIMSHPQFPSESISILAFNQTHP
jgi:hypothetical protein